MSFMNKRREFYIFIILKQKTLIKFRYNDWFTCICIPHGKKFTVEIILAIKRKIEYGIKANFCIYTSL